MNHAKDSPALAFELRETSSDKPTLSGCSSSAWARSNTRHRMQGIIIWTPPRRDRPAPQLAVPQRRVDEHEAAIILIDTSRSMTQHVMAEMQTG